MIKSRFQSRHGECGERGAAISIVIIRTVAFLAELLVMRSVDEADGEGRGEYEILKT